MKRFFSMMSMALVVIACVMSLAAACENNDPDPDPIPTPKPTPNPGSTTIKAIKLNKTSLELPINGREALTATVEPANASVQILTWRSSNEKVAKVSTTGEVHGVAAGKATITVRGGNVSASCTVTVTSEEIPVGDLEVSMTGTINHTTYTAGESATVTFSRFPRSVEEFKMVREQIGTEPQGAVALQVMAYEMFRRDRKIGEQVLRMNTTTTNITMVLSRLKSIFDGDAQSNRPYQMGAFLKGATPENGYNPEKPYTVEIIVDKGRKYEKFTTYQATLIHLMVLTKGDDGGKRHISVMQTQKPGQPGENGKFYIVNQSDGLHLRVKDKSFSTPFNGLD